MALTSSKKNCNYLLAIILKYSETCEIIVPTAKFPILYSYWEFSILIIEPYYWVSTLVRKIQSIGILGMILAIAGGIVWFFQQRLLALVLWGVAVIIILKINKQRKTKSKNKYRWFPPSFAYPFKFCYGYSLTLFFAI